MRLKTQRKKGRYLKKRGLSLNTGPDRLFPIWHNVTQSGFNVGVQNSNGLRLKDELSPIRQQRFELIDAVGRVFFMNNHQQIIRRFRGCGYDLATALALPIRDDVMNVPPIPTGVTSLRHFSSRVASPAAAQISNPAASSNSRSARGCADTVKYGNKSRVSVIALTTF